MLMVNTYVHSLDTKGRLTLPARFREVFASGVVITKGIGDYLDLYPYAAFEALAERVREKIPLAERDLLRYFFANAANEVPDRQGRILVPQMLREHARLVLGAEVVIAGVHDHLEIWNPELWNARMIGITPAKLEEKLRQYDV